MRDCFLLHCEWYYNIMINKIKLLCSLIRVSVSITIACAHHCRSHMLPITQRQQQK